MTVDLTNPVFADADKARLHLESVRWPNGPVCPHCGERDEITALKGKSHRPGLYKCKACVKQFTVTVGTVFERSKVPLNKWLLATYLLCGSKKGISSKQLERMLGVTYKTAWFMSHRLREAMREGKAVIGGENKVVEADETYVGGKSKNRAFRAPRKKEAVFALVERDGKVKSQHVPNVTAKVLRNALVTQADRASYLMTDEAPQYRKTGREFSGHGTVNHSIDEYVRGSFWHTNTIENYFSILKRGINGNYQSVSPKHLKRYLGEFDFRYNTRDIDDWARTAEALKGAEGKRVTYGGRA
ncbi:IS1595 family transposase [Minwuia sp.]|uniref:IS1595 family transposase n=1 Tax=Minwuia sp. TaxID=2493630 RepID=UPI003A919ACD